MDVTARPLLMSGVVVVAVAAVALPPSEGPSHLWPGDLTPVQLSAVQLPTLDPLAEALTVMAQWQPTIVDAADAVALPAAAAGSIGASIEAAYTALEEWVRYGVNFTAWAAGWVPFVGLLAPQINFFYDLGESVVQSWLFNTIDVLGGTISLGAGLSNLGADTMAAFNTFINTQIDWITHFFPPLPPVGLSAAALDLGTAVPDLVTASGVLFVPGVDVGLDALAGVTSDLAGNLGGLLLSLLF